MILMVTKQKSNKKPIEALLEELNNKIDVLILILAVQGKEEKEKIKIIKSFSRSFLSKREIEKITGVDRHKF